MNFSKAISPFNNNKLTVREMKNIFGNNRKTKLKCAEEPACKKQKEAAERNFRKMRAAFR